jgi:hypothetical protein
MDSDMTNLFDYQKAIESVIKSNSSTILKSSGSQHASIVTAKILQNSKSSVKIITGNFSGVVSDSNIYLEALKGYLERGQNLEILLTNFPNLNSLAYNLIIESKKINSNIQIKPLTSDGLKFLRESSFDDSELHFVIGDDKMFRLESDRNSYSSYCSFNDTKIVKKLQAIFEKCFNTTALLELDVREIYTDQGIDKICTILTPDFENINSELIEYFSKNPDDLYKLDPRKFEKLLDYIFRNQGFITELGPGSGDGGVDLRLIQKDSVGQILTLVQAKRYQKKYPIKLEAVQALSAIVEHEKANRGLFVTTSRYLPGVEKWVSEQPTRIILANSEDVANWCKSISIK